MPKVLMGARLVALLLFAGLCFVANAQLPGPTNVVSARIESVAAVPERTGLHIAMRNIGQRPITAFSIGFSHVDSSGDRVPCGGRGMDMIDWSDPMPRLNIYIHMRRNWVPPNGTASFEGYPRCPDGQVALESIQVALALIMFDDGTGEGDPDQIRFTLATRREARDERLKWVSRFTALREASDQRSSAQELYRDLVEATRAAEIDPENASRQGMAGPVRDELRRLALDIAQWTAHNERLQKSELLEWRITDLEHRTARLIQGAGKTDGNP
jgi:hypothetical protein